jgi:phosphopantothenoylcysteine decarboxylase/phosphopantothenate--cysteine ligase
MGYAIAEAARDRGATVSLFSTTGAPAAVGIDVVSVERASEMHAAVLEALERIDALVMAAAVADFRPKKAAGDKLKKRDGIPQLPLEAAPDVLAAVAGLGSGRPQLVIGFAAESRDLVENARAKLEAKGLDMIAANDVSAADAGFGADTNRVTLLYPDRKEEDLPLMSKDEVAEAVVARLASLLERR